MTYTDMITLTGDADEDGGKLVMTLDSGTGSLKMPLHKYPDYLRALASALRDRARQVDEEVDAGW